MNILGGLTTMHDAEMRFCSRVSRNFPQYFVGTRVFEGGSLHINGNHRFLFENSKEYVGCDLEAGYCVDVICRIHEYNARDGHFDVVFSTECFEHDEHWKESIANMYRMLKDGGLFFFTAASTGRPEHGTEISDGGWASPHTKHYYKNITEEMVRSHFDIDSMFIRYKFEYNPSAGDIYFWGIKIYGGFDNDNNPNKE